MLSLKLKQIDCNNIMSHSSAAQCIRYLPLKPDIVVLDYNLLRPNGIEVLRSIKERAPTTSIIILSEPDDNSIYNELLEFKDLQYVAKEKDSNRLTNILIQKINNTVEMKKKNKKLFEARMILLTICITILIMSIIIFIFK